MSYISNMAHSKHSPHACSPHFKKVDHWLTPEESEELGREVKQYADAHKDDDKELRRLFDTHFPKRIMDELKQVPEEPDTPVLHVVHGLPPTPMAKIEAMRRSEEARKERPKTLVTGMKQVPSFAPELTPAVTAADEEKGRWKKWIKEESHGAVISHGVCLSLGMKFIVPEALARFGKDEKIRGGMLHRDGKAHVSVLTGVLSDGASTRYVDWGSFLKEAVAQGLGNIAMSAGAHDQAIAIADLAQAFQEDPSLPLGINGVDGDESPEDTARVMDVLREYSYDVVIGPKDMVVAGNRGQVFHQALLSPHTQRQPGISRLIAVSTASPFRHGPQSR